MAIASSTAMAPSASRSARVGPLDQLHHDGVVFESVDRSDVGVVERREHLGFAVKPRQAVRIVRDGSEQYFDRDVPIEFRIAGAIHLSHSSYAQQSDYLIDAEPRAGGQGHVAGL